MTRAASGGNELLELFTRYNEDLWPLHGVAYAVAVVAVALVFARRADRGPSHRWRAGVLVGVARHRVPGHVRH